MNRYFIYYIDLLFKCFLGLVLFVNNFNPTPTKPYPDTI